MVMNTPTMMTMANGNYFSKKQVFITTRRFSIGKSKNNRVTDKESKDLFWSYIPSDA